MSGAMWCAATAILYRVCVHLKMNEKRDEFIKIFISALNRHQTRMRAMAFFSARFLFRLREI